MHNPTSFSSCSSTSSASALGSCSSGEESSAQAEKERKLAVQLRMLAKEMAKNPDGITSKQIILGFAFWRELQSANGEREVRDFWENLSKICFPDTQGRLPTGKIDEKTISGRLSDVKSFVQKKGKAKCPVFPFFTHTTGNPYDESEQTQKDVARIIQDADLVRIEQKAIDCLDPIVPGCTDYERKNNIRIMSSLMSFAFFLSIQERDEAASQRIFEEYDSGYFHSYYVLIELLRVPGVWQEVQWCVPESARYLVLKNLKDIGDRFKREYVKDLENILISLAMGCSTQEKKVEVKVPLLHTFRLVMMARYFAVYIGSDFDTSFNSYCTILKNLNRGSLQYYPEAAQTVQRNWGQLKPTFFSGLSYTQGTKAMLFIGATSSYTTPTRVRLAMQNCKSKTCQFCSDFPNISCGKEQPIFIQTSLRG